MRRSSSTINILPWLITITIATQSVECFTRPPIFSRAIIVPEKRGPTAGVLSPPSKTLLLQTHDTDDDVITTTTTTTVASKLSPDGTLDNDETTQLKASRKNPTLAELEDLEEARLAAEEKAAAAQQKLLQEQEEQFNGPSNLYTDVYNVNPKSISKIDPLQFLTTNDIIGDDDPMNISPQKEMDLAKKRDALQNRRLNEMFAEEDTANSQRQAKIQQLMKEDDKVWKEQRRKKLLGKYAEVDSWEEVEKMLGEDRKKEVKGTLGISFLLFCFVLYIILMLCVM